MLTRNASRRGRRAAFRLAGAVALCLAALAACAAPPAAAPPAAPVYEIIAQDVATSGGSEEPITLAVSGQQAMTGVTEGLPPVVSEELRAAAAQNPDALYLVVYAGVKPSSGYAVSIDSLSTPDSAAASPSLLVSYSVSEPGGAAATVLTYPYVIARVTSQAAAPDAVQFQQAP